MTIPTVSSAVPHTFEPCTSCSKVASKKANVFTLPPSDNSTSCGRKRKRTEDHASESARHAPIPKLRIVRTSLGYKAFPATEISAVQIPRQVQHPAARPPRQAQHPPTPLTPIRIIRTPLGYRVAPPICQSPRSETYSSKLRIVRTKDGGYKAFPAPTSHQL